MDLLKGDVKRTFLRYLAIVYASSFIASVYGAVDTAMVGWYHGPAGTATISIITMVFTIAFCTGMLTGVGGSIRYGTERGRKSGKENQYFTVSVLSTLFLALTLTAIVWIFEDPLIRLMGADDELFPLAKEYLWSLKAAVPAFMLACMIESFLRNDGSPGIATTATIAGGVFNLVGDYYFVFVCDMGIKGAGLATAIGSYITLLVCLTHFLLKRNTLRLCKVSNFPRKAYEMFISGFAAFCTDLAVGVLITVFNRRIMKYLGVDALAVYGVLTQVAMMVQCGAYSIGGAAQPLMSQNFGAKQWVRIKKTLKYALCSCLVCGLFWMLLSFIAPNFFIKLFMKPTEAVLAIAPGIVRVYVLAFIPLAINVFSTYYFQSLLQARTAFVIAIGRGFVVSCALVYLLPLLSPSLIWAAIPIAELLVCTYVIYKINYYTKNIELCGV